MKKRENNETVEVQDRQEESITALTEAEKRIEEARKRFDASEHEKCHAACEIGSGLRVIKDNELYRPNYNTFREYCDQVWKFTFRRAYQFIAAARVMDNLKRNNCSPLPDNESQLRQISGLSDEDQCRVWCEAVESAPDGRVTAQHIAAVRVESLTAPRKPKSRAGRKDSFAKAFGLLESAIIEQHKEGWKTLSKENARDRLLELLNKVEEERGAGSTRQQSSESEHLILSREQEA